MLRVESDQGWWLITHQDHARLAANFAAHWGNALFQAPHPRAEVLEGISVHDDGWVSRDACPSITRQGKPSAFSQELVGTYSAFEEIDLAEYLAVRENAMQQIEARSPYAALLVSMHTYNLLTARADRSSIALNQLPVLDSFLERQLLKQSTLRVQIAEARLLSQEDVSEETVEQNFRLLQATDNLSLLSCVSYAAPATLLHSLALVSSRQQAVDVLPVGNRTFRLVPYPFDQPLLRFELPARHVKSRTFASAKDLRGRFTLAPIEQLTVTITV